jgi:hypothetical protein
MRKILVALIALLAAAPAAAQHTGHAIHHAKPQPRGTLPAGWSARVDRDQPLDQLSFTAMGEGFHAVTGPAAVLYNPDWTRRGDYQASARFTQTRAPRHPEAYGLVIGGNDLAGADQAYSYFLVRGTGEFFIATRKGAERVKVVDWTPHAAIRKQDAQGVQVNVLGAEARGDQVIFTVNGTEVARRPRAEVLADGVFGFRVNHNLDVMIDQVLR